MSPSKPLLYSTQLPILSFEDNFKSIHYYIAIGVIIVLLAFTTTTVVSYRYSKRHEKTPDPITVEESEGEPEELGAKKFSRDLSGMFSVNL